MSLKIDYRLTLSQVLDELPALTFEERQLLIRRVIELDDPPLSQADVLYEVIERDKMVVVAAVLRAARHDREWKRRF